MKLAKMQKKAVAKKPAVKKKPVAKKEVPPPITAEGEYGKYSRAMTVRCSEEIAKVTKSIQSKADHEVRQLMSEVKSHYEHNLNEEVCKLMKHYKDRTFDFCRVSRDTDEKVLIRMENEGWRLIGTDVFRHFERPKDSTFAELPEPDYMGKFHRRAKVIDGLRPLPPMKLVNGKLVMKKVKPDTEDDYNARLAVEITKLHKEYEAQLEEIVLASIQRQSAKPVSKVIVKKSVKVIKKFAKKKGKV
jgi:hypothetical protein